LQRLELLGIGARRQDRSAILAKPAGDGHHLLDALARAEDDFPRSAAQGAVMIESCVIEGLVRKSAQATQGIIHRG
jgi:hypothetical protein